jgi:Ser-tRNA(Ala) deacylase AlaX
LPLSAVVEGTTKLYLEDFSLLECDASVVEAGMHGIQTATIVLDRTCVYPGGGGQACDLGKLTWDNGALTLTEVSKDKEGIVHHTGHLDGMLPAKGEQVHAVVAPERRLFNSRLHCVGHLLDYAIKKVDKNWKSGKSAHYPHMSFVDYDGMYDPTEVEALLPRIQQELNAVIQRGGTVGVKSVPSAEAHLYSEYIPKAILAKYQNVHLATYPDNFNVCCGGTHVSDVSEIGDVIITKIKKREGHIRVSYALASM